MKLESTVRLQMVQQLTPLEPALVTPVMADCVNRASSLLAFATQQFSPTLLPATSWISPIHPPLQPALKEES